MNTDSLSVQSQADTMASRISVSQIVIIPKEKVEREGSSDWMTFIAQIAWPILILFVIMFFRKEIRIFLKSVFDLIGKVKFGKVGPVAWSTIDNVGRIEPAPAESAPAATRATRPHEGVPVEPEPPAGGRRIPSEAAPKPIVGALSREERKILSTLWYYQKQFDMQVSVGKVWTFLVYPNSPQYGEFMIGMGRLLDKALVTWNAESGQFYLTQTGIRFCRENEGDLGGDRYSF